MRGTFLLTILVLHTIMSKAQNVGIGTTAPQARLDIQSTGSGLLIPRLTTTQKNGIVSPSTGLLVFDSTKKLFSFYNSTGWSDIKPVTSNDSIWTSYTSNSELNVYNNIGQHFYLNGFIMKDIGSGGTIDGILKLEHATGFAAGWNSLALDGQRIQSRHQPQNIQLPPTNANLLLNPFGGNVGIGSTNPSIGKLQVDMPDDNYALLINGGVAQLGMIVRNTAQPYGPAGAFIATRSNHPLFFSTNNSAPMVTLTTSGKLGIGTQTPSSMLTAVSTDPLYSGIEGNGRGYTYQYVPHPSFPYGIFTHNAALKANADSKAVALEINGPVAVSGAGSEDFVFDLWPQGSDASAAGYYYPYGPWWAINLTGTGTILSDTTFNVFNSYIFVETLISWTDNPGDFILPNRQMLCYTGGLIRYIMDVQPVQAFHPVIRLRVMVIRKNPDTRNY